MYEENEDRMKERDCLGYFFFFFFSFTQQIHTFWLEKEVKEQE
jgi:hypothetical protein